MDKRHHLQKIQLERPCMIYKYRYYTEVFYLEFKLQDLHYVYMIQPPNERERERERESRGGEWRGCLIKPCCANSDPVHRQFMGKHIFVIIFQNAQIHDRDHIKIWWTPLHFECTYISIMTGFVSNWYIWIDVGTTIVYIMVCPLSKAFCDQHQ